MKLLLWADTGLPDFYGLPAAKLPQAFEVGISGWLSWGTGH